MKKINTPLIAIAIAIICTTFSFSACDIACKQGSGKMVSENREVSGFDKLDISGSYNVVIKQDPVESLTVTADDNLLGNIKSDVSGHELHIRSKGNMCSSGKFTLTISLRDLTGISTSGAVELTSNGKIKAKDVELDMSGATKITMDLDAGIVNTTGSGITELNLKGQAGTHNVKLSGGGEINALDFVVAKYNIESSGATHCKINVLNRLDLDSSGASEVEYRGNPTTINNNKTGAASLKKLE